MANILEKTQQKQGTPEQFRAIKMRCSAGDFAACVNAAAKASLRYGRPYYVYAVYASRGFKISAKKPVLPYGNPFCELITDTNLLVTLNEYRVK